MFAYSCASAKDGNADIAASCKADLETIAPFMLENDTGAKDHLKQKGQAYFDAALAQARQQAAKAKDWKTCKTVLTDYLLTWRKSHLYLYLTAKENTAGNTLQGSANKIDPELKILSDKTILLTLPSFDNAVQPALEQLIKTKREILETHANWIIDVRENSGGADSSYYALLPWLMPDEFGTVNAEFLVTPANIKVQESICSLSDPAQKSCAEYLQNITKEMRKLKPGDYFLPNQTEIIYERSPTTPANLPKRVAVLMDNACASSCEQFLLTVRQSFNVKLLGRSSMGALDYSNLRPFALPSGQFQLLYATTRSKRIPHLQVDVAGIMPDIYLPPPGDQKARDAEIQQARSFLENGRLTPGK
ncbi:S41 family peptidase [Undibacterium sp. TJN19]|uniref:S41 family peptidase n=1 Tax=Undibacterium sp. TJN19 TaxID=3413055 RepID=UPI003BF268F1